jgi:hypothetical protein
MRIIFCGKGLEEYHVSWLRNLKIGYHKLWPMYQKRIASEGNHIRIGSPLTVNGSEENQSV